MRRLAMARALLISVSALAPANPVAPASSGPPPTTTSVPQAGSPRPEPVAPDHIMIVVFENKPFEHQVGNRNAPYLNRLLAESAVFTQSYGVTHPSQLNYLALFSGSTQKITSDACLQRFHGVPNLGSQLIAAGRTFVAYSEGLPHAGFRGCSQGRYAAKHSLGSPSTRCPTPRTSRSRRGRPSQPHRDAGQTLRALTGEREQRRQELVGAQAVVVAVQQQADTAADRIGRAETLEQAATKKPHRIRKAHHTMERRRLYEAATATQSTRNSAAVYFASTHET